MSVSSAEFELGSMNHGVLQGSVSGAILFVTYISDLHFVIKASDLLHFAEDISLLNIQSSIKQINRTLNKDLKQLVLWMNANKVS